LSSFPALQFWRYRVIVEKQFLQSELEAIAAALGDTAEGLRALGTEGAA
jgi:hypothetical protein